MSWDSLFRDPSYIRMATLLVPQDENELMLVASLLESEGIHYYIHNEHFGGLYPGLNIFPLNERKVLVDEDDYERAFTVTSNFLHVMEQAFQGEDEERKGQVSTIRRPGHLPQNTGNGASPSNC